MIRGSHHHDAFCGGVIDVVEQLDAPRKALGAGSSHSHLTESIEPEVPQFDVILQVAAQERIKFRVDLAKLIAVLDGKRVGLESIDSDCHDLVLV